VCSEALQDIFYRLEQALQRYISRKRHPVVFHEAPEYLDNIGKYLSRLRKFDHVVAPQEGFEAQLQASRVPITFGMRALGMTRQRGDGLLHRVIEPCHVPGLQSLDNAASDMHGTHGYFARRHGHLREELGHRGQKPLERRGGNGGPNQPLDDRGIGGVKGMQIGVRFPFFKQ